ncbi:hypothetical protein [Mucilaginibacter jinjuensis]|uniref:Uncharacterized protein n=1 Tax=Mucilaginibacter jinjuensis TaxID=1176721 RepID=A0ABY7TCW1_9SPHI|nr:hypothetical protein [Mucilaginibacter jinjuensis]WCT14355.1 hypothetical protein PQO05_10465 [Mucilaginibacter jinjuensis]
MAGLQEGIEAVLGKFILAEIKQSQTNGFNARHIFHDLEENFKDNLTEDEVSTMFYAFLKYEEALSKFKQKQPSSGNFILTHLQALEIEYNKSVRSGMNSLFKAVVAYQAYAELNYEAALYELSDAIQLAIDQGETFPLFLACVQEQWLNKLRVLFKAKNLSILESETIGLIVYSLTGRFEMDPRAEAGFFKINSEMQTLMLDHVLRNIILRLSGQDLQSIQGPFYFNDFIQAIIKGSWERISKTQVFNFNNNVIKMLSTLYVGDAVGFLAQLYDNFDAFLTANIILRSIVLMELYHLQILNNLDLSNHRNYPTYFECFNQLCDPGLERYDNKKSVA